MSICIEVLSTVNAYRPRVATSRRYRRYQKARLSNYGSRQIDPSYSTYDPCSPRLTSDLRAAGSVDHQQQNEAQVAADLAQPLLCLPPRGGRIDEGDADSRLTLGGGFLAHRAASSCHKTAAAAALRRGGAGAAVSAAAGPPPRAATADVRPADTAELQN